MAFGFFKRAAEYADTIFTNGTIYTGTADEPWAEAVAVKDGRVMAVGDSDSIDDLSGSDTDVIDLEGRFLLPGFIELSGTPVKRVFAGQYAEISLVNDIDGVVAELRSFAEENPEREVVFGVGYNDKILHGLSQEERREALDSVSTERPVVALSANGFSAWFNQKAADILKTAMEEDEVEHLTISYMMSVLDCLDFDDLERRTLEVAGEYSELGVTSILNVGSIDCFDGVYQDILLNTETEGMLRQRFFGTLFAAQALETRYVVAKLRQRRTYCSEIEWGVEFSGLCVTLTDESGYDLGDCEAEDEGETDETQENGDLTALIEAAADAGFDVRIIAGSVRAAIAGATAMKEAAGAGFGKNRFTLTVTAPLPEDVKTTLRDLGLGETFVEIAPAAGTDDRLSLSAINSESAGSVSDAIDLLTIDAAMILGKDADLGTVEEGKAADFAIFEENPLEIPTLSELRKLRAVMTVVNGRIAYDEDEEVNAEWCDLITGMYV